MDVLFGIGGIMSLTILISKLLSMNFLASHNSLSTVAEFVGGVQFFLRPCQS